MIAIEAVSIVISKKEKKNNRQFSVNIVITAT